MHLANSPQRRANMVDTWSTASVLGQIMLSKSKSQVGWATPPPRLRPSPWSSWKSSDATPSGHTSFHKINLSTQFPPRMRKVGQHDSAACIERNSLHSWDCEWSPVWACCEGASLLPSHTPKYSTLTLTQHPSPCSERLYWLMHWFRLGEGEGQRQLVDTCWYHLATVPSINHFSPPASGNL